MLNQSPVYSATRYGRQSAGGRFFLITGTPIIGLCLWLIPEARLLWHIVVLVLLYQFFQDVMWGSDHPLMADLFPPKQRLFVSGMLITAGNLTGWVFMKYGMGILNSGNLSSDELYRIVAVIQVVLVSGLSFFLNEKPIVKKDGPKLTFKRYAADLFQHPIRRKFAALFFFISLLINIAVLGGFLALFAKYNLGATKAEYGDAFSVSVLPPLFLSIPVALFIEKYVSKRAALIRGIIALIIALCIGWMAQSIDQLFWLAILWGMGYMLIIGTFKPFFSEYVASDIIGQISGALNICWGVGRLLAILVTGFAIDFIFDDNYRFIFPLAIAMGCISLYLAFLIRDLRFEARRSKKEGIASL